MLNLEEFIDILKKERDRRIANSLPNPPVRVGDVAEHDDLHCGVGSVVVRNGKIVINPGDDSLWKDESLATKTNVRRLWDSTDEEGEGT